MLLLTQARSPTKSGWYSAVWEGWCGNPSGSRPNSFGRQHLTFDKGRTWMPEVERPEFRKDAKPTERSYGKSVGGFRGIVRFFGRVGAERG